MNKKMISTMKSELPSYFQEYLDGRFQGVEDKIDDLRKQISRLDFTTNPDHLELVKRVVDIESRTESLEKWRNILAGVWLALVIFATIFGFSIKQFVVDIVNHVYKR